MLARSACCWSRVDKEGRASRNGAGMRMGCLWQVAHWQRCNAQVLKQKASNECLLQPLSCDRSFPFRTSGTPT